MSDRTATDVKQGEIQSEAGISEGGSLQSPHDEQWAPNRVTTAVRIAPPSASEKNEQRAARYRSRRERPQALKLAQHADGTGSTDNQLRITLEPDVDSFVSGCIPGVSFVSGDNKDDGLISQRRTRSVRKRPLPMMSYLASTHLAAAERKRRKEEQERQNAIAEEEAKRALLLNPILPPMGAADVETKMPPGGELTNTNQQESLSEAVGRGKQSGKPQESPPVLTTTTTTTENASNILMPPLLKQFLAKLEK